MILPLPGVLGSEALARIRGGLEGAAWIDGRGTAGHLSAGVKDNQQLHWSDPLAQALGGEIRAALEAHPMFLSAALPRTLLPPLFNRHAGGGRYGPHIDGAIRAVEGSEARLRTDLALTLFLSEPETYAGGELEILEPAGGRAFRLAAGDALLYPASSVHQVRPVTRGVRYAAFTWIQSLVRDPGLRAELFELDVAIQRLAAGEAAAARLGLVNVYHNLLRRFADL